MGTLRLNDLPFLARVGSGGAVAASYLLLETGAGDYVLQEGGTDKIVIDSTSSSGSDKPIINLDAATSLAAGDLLLISHDPSGSVVSQKLSVQAFFNAIDLLGASGALALADVLPLFTGGAAKKATVQTILDAVANLTASTTALDDADQLLVSRSTAWRTTLRNMGISAPVLNPDFRTWTVRWAIANHNSTLTGATTLGDAWTGVVSGTGSTASAHDNATALQPVGKKATAGAGTGRYAANNGRLASCWNNAITTHIVCRLLQTTDCRFHAGLFSGGYADFDDQDDVVNGEWCSFRFSSNAGDTEFMVGSGTGGVLNDTWYSTGVAPDTDTVYLLETRLRDDGLVDVYVNRERTNTGLTMTLDVDTPLRVVAGITSLAAAAKSFTLFETRVMQRFLY